MIGADNLGCERLCLIMELSHRKHARVSRWRCDAGARVRLLKRALLGYFCVHCASLQRNEMSWKNQSSPCSQAPLARWGKQHLLWASRWKEIQINSARKCCRPPKNTRVKDVIAGGCEHCYSKRRVFQSPASRKKPDEAFKTVKLSCLEGAAGVISLAVNQLTFDRPKPLFTPGTHYRCLYS